MINCHSFMKKAALAASCAAALSACTHAYKAPDANAIAKVRFYIPEVAQAAQSVGVYAFEDDNCGGASKLRQLGGIQLGGMSASDIDINMWKDAQLPYPKNAYVEIPVPADQRFNFTVVGSYAFATCNLTMSFLPRADAQYEVSYVTQGRQCNARVDEISLIGTRLNRIKEPSTRRNARPCTFFWN